MLGIQCVRPMQVGRNQQCMGAIQSDATQISLLWQQDMFPAVLCRACFVTVRLDDIVVPVCMYTQCQYDVHAALTLSNCWTANSANVLLCTQSCIMWWCIRNQTAYRLTTNSYNFWYNLMYPELISDLSCAHVDYLYQTLPCMLYNCKQGGNHCRIHFLEFWDVFKHLPCQCKLYNVLYTQCPAI